jgi:hypothetical protein
LHGVLPNLLKILAGSNQRLANVGSEFLIFDVCSDLESGHYRANTKESAFDPNQTHSLIPIYVLFRAAGLELFR